MKVKYIKEHESAHVVVVPQARWDREIF